MNTGSRWVLAQFVVLLLIAVAFVASGRPPHTVSTIIAVLLFAGGQGMAIAAALQMRQYISVHPAPVPGASMLAGGIYGLVRHPMYGGVLLMAAAVAVFDRNLVAGALTVVLAAVFVGKARYEETLLVHAFLGYEDYRRRVTRRFIPWMI